MSQSLAMILTVGVVIACYRQPALIPLVIIYGPLAFSGTLQLDEEV